MRLSIALLVLMSAAPASGADPFLPHYLPPGTKVILGMSLRGLANSSLIESLRTEAGAWSASVVKSGPLPELDPLKDIDDLIVASTGKGETAPTLIVIHGRFNIDRWTVGAKRYNEVAIFTDAKHPDAALALLDASTAIAGELPQVRAAIDRHRKAAPSPLPYGESLARRAQSMAGRFDLWGLGDLPEGAHPLAGAADGFDSIDRFEFGLSLRQGLELSGEIHVKSPKDVEKLMSSASLFEALIKGQNTSSTGTKFNLEANKGTLKVSLVVPEADLKKGIEAQKTNLAAALKSRFEIAPAAPPRLRPSKPVVVTNKIGDTVSVTLPGGN